jgi:copper(I)-binding protein
MFARSTSPVRLIALATTVLLLAACTSSGASPAASTGSMRVENAWARASMGMDRAGAAYLALTNDTGQTDALIAARSSAAATVELHETSADASGQMAMHPIDRIDLPIGSRIALEPGGRHIMLIGLTADLVAGQEVQLTLDFEHAPDLIVKAPVTAN